jgi:hypothetical protein
MGGAAATIVTKDLGLDMLQRLIDGDDHVGSFGQTDQVPAPTLHRNFGDVAVLLDSENDFALEVIAQDFGEFAEAGFNLITNGGSDFVLPTEVLYVH